MNATIGERLMYVALGLVGLAVSAACGGIVFMAMADCWPGAVLAGAMGVGMLFMAGSALWSAITGEW
jgi:hypothetical protein